MLYFVIALTELFVLISVTLFICAVLLIRSRKHINGIERERASRFLDVVPCDRKEVFYCLIRRYYIARQLRAVIYVKRIGSIVEAAVCVAYGFLEASKSSSEIRRSS